MLAAAGSEADGGFCFLDELQKELSLVSEAVVYTKDSGFFCDKNSYFVNFTKFWYAFIMMW